MWYTYPSHRVDTTRHKFPNDYFHFNRHPSPRNQLPCELNGVTQNCIGDNRVMSIPSQPRPKQGFKGLTTRLLFVSEPMHKLPVMFDRESFVRLARRIKRTIETAILSYPLRKSTTFALKN